MALMARDPTSASPTRGNLDVAWVERHRIAVGGRLRRPLRSAQDERGVDEMADPFDVTDELIGSFAADGVVLLRQVLDPTWMELVDLGIERNLRNPGPHHQQHYEGTPRAFVDDYCNYWAVPEYRMLVEHSPIAAIVASILQSQRLWLFYEQIFVKEAPTTEARRTPWHQDTTYWITGGHQLAGFWITVDDTPADESLEFVRGSHVGPTYAGTAFDYDDETAPFARLVTVSSASPTSRPTVMRSTSSRSRSSVVTSCCSIRGCCTAAVPARPARRSPDAVDPVLRRRCRLRTAGSAGAALPGHRRTAEGRRSTARAMVPAGVAAIGVLADDTGRVRGTRWTTT